MKLTKLLIVGVAVLFLAVSANAGTLTYSPDSFSLSVEAGSSQTVTFQTNLTGSTVTSCDLEYSLVGLPASWVTLLPSGSISRVWGRYLPLSSQLTLMVPAKESPGIYTGYLIPSVKTSSAETINVGSGIKISVTVPATGCAASPEFTNILYPDKLWSPSDKTVNVEMSGTCIVPAGCTLSGAWYEIIDEYGVYSASNQEFAVAPDGSFSVSIPIETSRKGGDKDGRMYTIKFYAKNEAGTGESSEFFVNIPHDQAK